QMRHAGLGSTRQAAELAERKAAFPAYQDISSQVWQEVLRRVDKTFAACFRRVQQGEQPGSPRFKRSGRARSFTSPQSGFALAGNLLTLARMGDLTVRVHRPLGGAVNTCTSKRDVNHGDVTCSCEVA